MKITFNFNQEIRAFHLETEDNLEYAILKEMESATAKGQTISIRSIKHPETSTESFLVEMKVNGEKHKVRRLEDVSN